MRITLLLMLALTVNAAIAQTPSLTLQEIHASGKFRAESVGGLRSMNNGEHYTSLERGSIKKYSYSTGELIETVLDGASFKHGGKVLSIDNYQFSDDESTIMIANGVESIYRHSTREDNYLYDLKTKSITKISNDGKQRYATFSPDGSKVAYVRGNNLHVLDLKTKATIQVTKDGEFNKIIEGATDWVYEEEFAFDKGFAWSAKGNFIAYYRFDESAVKEFSMDMFGTLYPEQYKFKYPKCGEDNAKVDIYMFSLKSGKSKKLDLGTYEYIPRIKWTKTDNLLSVQRMNRHQNQLNLLIVEAETGVGRVILSEESKTYIDITDNLTFLDDEKHFVWTSEKDGYHHIYLHAMSGKQVSQVTEGAWDVTLYLGYDEVTKKVYYESAEVSPLERHCYSIDLQGKGKKQLTTRSGWNSTKFSKGFKYYINYHSTANQPSYITLHHASGKELRILKDNRKLVNLLDSYKFPQKSFIKIKTDKAELNASIIKPADFDEKKKYPVLMYVYGGPGSQTVQDKWSRNYLWHQYMAAQGYIVVSVDNRGTGARGENFKKCTYLELGKLEVEDQIAAAKYLGGLAYVDDKRIGIWGWSFGGYMSSLCISKGADVFSTAVAVAPVTNWRYYDSIYTERYMRTPQENADGYDKNSPINHVEKIKGSYLLIHGMADDNVHFQNAVEMTESLIQANVDFDLMMYPDRNHGIYGKGARLHLFSKVTKFFLENL